MGRVDEIRDGDTGSESYCSPQIPEILCAYEGSGQQRVLLPIGDHGGPLTARAVYIYTKLHKNTQ